MLGTARLTWRRLDVICQKSAVDPSSMLWRDLAGDMADWDLKTQLAAATANATRVLAWQNTKDATSKDPKHYPEPTLPPAAVEPEPEKPRLSVTQLDDFRKRTKGA